MNDKAVKAKKAELTKLVNNMDEEGREIFVRQLFIRKNVKDITLEEAWNRAERFVRNRKGKT